MTVRIKRAAFEAMWNDQKVTTEEIAAAFCINRNSVTPIGQRFGLPPRKPGPKPKWDADLFRALWEARVSSAEICKAFGMTARNYPGVMAQQLGLSKRPQGMRGTITLADFRAAQLRDAMAATAKAEQTAARAMWRAA